MSGYPLQDSFTNSNEMDLPVFAGVMAMLRQQRELVPKPHVEQKKEECGVHRLRTRFIDLRAKPRLRCFCYFAQ